MEMQTAILIFIVIFALAIGFFLGLFLISLDAPFLKKLFLKEEVDDSPVSDDEAADDPQQKEVPIQRKPSPESALILQVWQEEGKAPVYETDGNYVAKEDLPQDILNLITIHEEPAQEAPAAPQPPAEPTPAPDPIPDPVPDVVPEGEEEEESEIKLLSVVDEVNEILQRRLHGSPLAGKGIHLMENHKQEIRFWVGLESFDDVEDIPDPEIRELIDAAVKEWEQKRE